MIPRQSRSHAIQHLTTDECCSISGRASLANGRLKHSRLTLFYFGYSIVNMAARLESGTHQFHVDILMSDTFYSMLSRGVKQLCRRIDRVTVKGSVQPMSLYTYDVPPCTANTIDELAFEDGMDFWEHFKPRTTQAYRENYAHAVQKYLDGNWGDARDEINICLQECPEDGPASVLLEVMEKHDFVAPKDWRGYRELINK